MNPGKIRLLKHLGTVAATGDDEKSFAVFYIKYESATLELIAAKLAIPLGPAPQSGWPVSLWCHGFGDPGGDLYKWPFAGDAWRLSRGELACRWAHQGIATLTPWLPGAGPSGAIGTFSPLSLDLNACAVLDGFAALQQLPDEIRGGQVSIDGLHPVLNQDCQVLRVDCLSSALLIEIASKYRSFAQCKGLRSFVADNFHPSIAYTVACMGPLIQDMSAFDATRWYCVWGRLCWSLAEERGWPVTRFLTSQAIELFGVPTQTPAGLLARIVAQPFQPAERNELARVVVNAAKRRASVCSGREVYNWMFSDDFKEWSSQAPLSPEMLAHPFYKTYLARSDPFFTESIVPFAPDVPLLVVPRVKLRTDTRQKSDVELRRDEMTSRKIETLKSWGWDVVVCPESECYGTSFGEGLARQWTLLELKKRLAIHC